EAAHAVRVALHGADVGAEGVEVDDQREDFDLNDRDDLGRRVVGAVFADVAGFAGVAFGEVGSAVAGDGAHGFVAGGASVVAGDVGEEGGHAVASLRVQAGAASLWMRSSEAGVMRVSRPWPCFSSSRTVSRFGLLRSLYTVYSFLGCFRWSRPSRVRARGG